MKGEDFLNEGGLIERVEQIYLEVSKDFKKIIHSDPLVGRHDTCKGLLHLLSRINEILLHTNSLGVEERAKVFNITYNAVTYSSDVASIIRKSNYSFEVIKPLRNCIYALENNLILQDVKYLDKRTRLYLDICQIYQENQCSKSAVSLLDEAISKYKQLKSIHEMDLPVPLHIETLLQDNIKILKIMHIKYSVQEGLMSHGDWRKKVDEQFGDDSVLKLMCLSECLKTETRKQANPFQKNSQSTMTKSYKENLLQSGYQIVKNTMETLSKALKEQKEKIEREVDFKKTENLTQELINEEIKKKREFQEKNVKEAEWRKASASFPLEYHAQMIHYAYEMKNSKLLNELLALALLRIECRRIEVPYINDIGVLASSTPFPNIENGYEKIPIDLNEANLKNQLKKLRKTGMKEELKASQIKDQKKGGKGEEKNMGKEVASEWQLEQIQHKYVFLILKKSMSPENAIYRMDIVMGHEEDGPVGYLDTRRIIVPYIQEDMKCLQSGVDQYKGVRETTHMVPYIVLHHSKDGLENDEEKKTLVTDVQPVMGKNPMMPSKWGYHKIPVDLRQVPEQFIKSGTHDYVYLSYQTDELFHIYSRHIRILNALNELENSTTSDKANNVDEEKLLQLGITYHLDKLSDFFSVMAECLEGALGQEYYKSRIDFLTNLAFHLWSKYLRDPLIQFDYVNEMRVNDDIIDYDYEQYRRNLQICKPIFLNAFKVLNLILINNPRSDILFVSRVNLELVKLQEENQEYRAAGDNVKMCLDRIRVFRDDYLTKGVQGNADRLLPFSLSSSNILIKETLSRMKDKFRQQKNYINKLKRIKKRSMENSRALNDKELEQEENQFLHYEKKDEVDDIIEKIPTHHSHLISILMAIELDLANLYFRVMLKNVDAIKRQELVRSGTITNGIKEVQLGGLANSTIEKLKLPDTPGEQRNNKNLKQLQSTLIKAEKLPPPKPDMHNSEKKLIEEVQKNPYYYSLLLTNLAAMHSQTEDKKYYLHESLKNIEKCIQVEKEQSELAIQNSIFLFSILWDDLINPEKSSCSVSPFKELYDGTWPASSIMPCPPILVGKSSSLIVLKHPPFKPKEARKKVKHMSIYGKPSANGVDVSYNCDELEGTGIKNHIDEVVKITNLKPNNIYCFASAPTNQEEELEQIGKTSKDIATCHPLPIPMLASYLAKFSYQIGEYDIAENAAKIIASQYCEKSYCQTYDERIDQVFYSRFKETHLNSVSLLEIRSISESLYILALCERRKLMELKDNGKLFIPILVQEKEKNITNLLLLSSLLNPSLASPINSIPYLIPDSQILLKALSLTLIPQKWMNSRLKKLGVKVMEKVMKWGLQNNQISLSRRIMYKWSERNWIMLGKTIQVQEKKDPKKGGKESKDQEVKLIDKYCRMIVEKQAGIFDAFEDSLAFISEQYSDYTNMFIERAKQQIAYYSQYVDNPPEELETISNQLTLKLQLVQYLKDPLNSLKKIPETSPFYLQYNCKILKKALENTQESEYKTLLGKAEDLNPPKMTPELSLSREIYSIMKQAISSNIEWIPSAKNEFIRLQEKTGKSLQKQISLYEEFQVKNKQLSKKISVMDSFVDKFKDFDYLNLWFSELYYLKAIINILNCPIFEVRNPIKGKYLKIRQMNLMDLVKKVKEVEVLEKQSYKLKEQDLEKIHKIMEYLCQAAFCCYCSQNWIKLQNIFRVVFNLITKYMMTPFSHRENQLWENLTLISIFGISMLEKIKEKGFDQFKKRYDLKVSRTQLKIVSQKLEIPTDTLEVSDIFEPAYYLPSLIKNATKNYWFENEKRLDLQVIGSIIAYTVQTLRMENKYNLVINLTRDFCNVTQHCYSLEFLPFMIQSQQKLRDEVQVQFDMQIEKLNEITKEYNKKKASKMKGQRQHKLSNESLPYEVEYKEAQKKIDESMQLLTNQKNFILSQIEASKDIIDEIKRDTSKTVLKLREQRKYMLQFGEDEEHMFKNYGDDTRLAKNRKNAIKKIIENYEKIHTELKNNKTSKDTLAEIQNRNDTGNLYFAVGNYEWAKEMWSDALANIFKKVHPIQNYREILEERKVFLVNSVGEKEVLIGLNLLYKISKFGSFHKVQEQQKSMRFACQLALALYREDGEHPQNLLGHSKYRMKKLSASDSLSDEASVNLNELILSLEYFSFKAIDSNKAINCLPLLTLHEYLTTDVVKNVQYSMKSKIIKVIALAESGLISQAIYYLMKAYYEKDLPNTWVDPSDHYQREKGKNWCLEEFVFDNRNNWTENKQAIQNIRKLTLKADFINSYGLINPILFNYGRGLILMKIHEIEVSDNYEINEARIQVIQQSQTILRECLKKLSFVNQHYQNLQTTHNAKLNFRQNQVSQDAEKAYKESQRVMIDYLKANGVDEPLLKRYEQQEENMGKKTIRVELMARIRLSIHQSYLSRRLYSNSYHVLKNGLENLKRYAYGARKVESGQDAEIQSSVAPPIQGSKKQEKKGGKKEEEKVQPVKMEINWEKQGEMEQEAQASLTRAAIDVFWNLKMTFQLGHLMYRQNRFSNAISIFNQLISYCDKYEDQYFKLFAQAYIERCSIRLGSFDPQKMVNLIKEADKKGFKEKEYVELVMDFGELLDNKESLSYFEKGREASAQLWIQLGMKSTLSGFSEEYSHRLFSGEDNLTLEQKDLIDRKGKKGEKKGGKDEKKGGKKEDGKKKKEENKLEYKVEPLCQYEWSNLQDEQKKSFEGIPKPHPNFRYNNIYMSIPLLYIKCYIRYLSLAIQDQFDESLMGQLPYIEKLQSIIKTYPYSTYYYQLNLFYISGELNKRYFVHQLRKVINEGSNPGLKYPFEDLPLNSELIKLPSYSNFIFNNRKYLVESRTLYQKLVGLLKNSCLLLEAHFKIDDVLWKVGELELFLAEYRGRLFPKYCQIDKTSEEKKEDQLDELDELDYLKAVGEAFYYLELSSKVASIVEDLQINYCELGNKPLEPNAKVDQDIISQIAQIDRQFKSKYPKFLADTFKQKTSISSTELISYMLKLYRESEYLTFSNFHRQGLILKCHRILFSGLLAYKEKCILSGVQYIPKKSIQDKFIEKETFVFKAMSKGTQIQFRYILGEVEDNDKIYYGKVCFQSSKLSFICEKLYRIRSKMAVSEKRSEAIKQRDFTLYMKDLDKILIQLGKKFNPSFTSLPQQLKIQLKSQNLTLLIKMLENWGAKANSTELVKFLRHLHEIKYNIQQTK